MYWSDTEFGDLVQPDSMTLAGLPSDQILQVPRYQQINRQSLKTQTIFIAQKKSTSQQRSGSISNYYLRLKTSPAIKPI
jgi:hypothetical protein